MSLFNASQPGAFLFVRPARTYSNGCKSPNRPDSGKVAAKGKGVHREVESEGSRRQKGWPDEQELGKRLESRGNAAEEAKAR